MRRSRTLKTPEGNVQAASLVAPLSLQQGETLSCSHLDQLRSSSQVDPDFRSDCSLVLTSFQTRLVCEVGTLVPEVIQVGFVPNLKLRTQLVGSCDKTCRVWASAHARMIRRQRRADTDGQRDTDRQTGDGGTGVDALRFDRVSSKSSGRVRGFL